MTMPQSNTTSAQDERPVIFDRLQLLATRLNGKTPEQLRRISGQLKKHLPTLEALPEKQLERSFASLTEPSALFILNYWLNNLIDRLNGQGLKDLKSRANIILLQRLEWLLQKKERGGQKIALERLDNSSFLGLQRVRLIIGLQSELQDASSRVNDGQEEAEAIMDSMRWVRSSELQNMLLSDRTGKKVRAITAALERIERGVEYLHCQGPKKFCPQEIIPRPRLYAVPEADRCCSCQRLLESPPLEVA